LGPGANLYLNYFFEMGDMMARAAREPGGISDDVRRKITSQIMAKYQTEVVDPVAWERDHRPVGNGEQV
jgi:hypothetical protein